MREKKVARKGIEHNRLLLTINMMKGGMQVMEAWRSAGAKIKRSQAAKRGAIKRKEMALERI